MSSQSLERSRTIQMKLLPILTMLLLRSLNLLRCRCFFGDIHKDSNHKDIFHVDNIDNNVNTLIDDENEKIKELRELRVGSSCRRGVYNAIALQGFQNLLLSPGFFFLLEML